MNKSENINELAMALSKAQLEMPPAKKTGFNPHFKSFFSTLGDIWEACSPALGKHGLSVLQIPALIDGKPAIETLLVHSSGQWILGMYPVTPLKLDPQSIGSATSYARRYSLAAIVCVVTEDDDGEASVGRKSDAKADSSKPLPTREAGFTRDGKPASATGNADWQKKPVTQKQVGMLKGLWEQLAKRGADLGEWKPYLQAGFGKESAKDLTGGEASQLIDYFQNSLKGLEAKNAGGSH